MLKAGSNLLLKSTRVVSQRQLLVKSAVSYNINNSIKSSSSFYNQKRLISSNSWAQDKLEDAGVKLDQDPPMKEVLVTEELLQEISPEVKSLCDQILNLNVIQVNQLLNRLQVCLKLFKYIIYLIFLIIYLFL
jgi:hypothetical protein